VSQALVVLAVVVVLGAFIGAPVGERANPGMSPNPAKAPWYFMGFQELLIHLHPVFAVFILPLAGLAGLMALPWIADDNGPKGRWFITEGARKAALVAAVAALIVTTAGVVIDELTVAASTAQHGWMTRGLIPTVLLCGIVVGLAYLTKRRFALGRNEVVQTVVVFMGVAITVLTLVGQFFRGPGMTLIIPWGG
jgi:quinol-cytochrome oxidoreductase complex cytochrome b subunit